MDVGVKEAPATEGCIVGMKGLLLLLPEEATGGEAAGGGNDNNKIEVTKDVKGGFICISYRL
jgi:hypothetical protein